jgi:hypothetical protein
MKPNPQPHTKPAPMHSKYIDPLPRWEMQRLERQAELLRMAEEGEPEALAWVKAKLVRWERKGRVIIG